MMSVFGLRRCGRKGGKSENLGSRDMQDEIGEGSELQSMQVTYSAHVVEETHVAVKKMA